MGKQVSIVLFPSDTSRPRKPSEAHGKDYYFVSRDIMQHDINHGKFIEHGEYKGNLYGTSVDGIRDLIHAGYQPTLAPHYQVSKQNFLILLRI